MSKDSRGFFYCFWNGSGIKRGRGGTSVCPGMIGGQGKGQKQRKDQCRKEGTLSSPSLPSKKCHYSAKISSSSSSSSSPSLLYLSGQSARPEIVLVLGLPPSFFPLLFIRHLLTTAWRSLVVYGEGEAAAAPPPPYAC